MVLVVPVLLVFLAAGVMVISAARARIELTGAAREGARVAATSPDPARAIEAVKGALEPGVRDRVRIRVSRPEIVGKPAEVVVMAQHSVAIPLLRSFAFTITARAVMLVER